MRVLIGALLGVLAGYVALRYVLEPVDQIKFHPLFREESHHYSDLREDDYYD